MHKLNSNAENWRIKSRKNFAQNYALPFRLSFCFFNLVPRSILKIALGRRLKKQNDRLKGSLGRVLFAAELEFPKILATEGHLNIHILHEYAEMLELSKQVYY